MRAAAAALLALLPGLGSAAEIVPPPDLPAADTWVRTDGGQIRVLDKQKAQSHLLPLKVGQTVTYETLSLTLLACVVHPPDLVGAAAGFLQITDSRAGEPGFRGWMLAREPGLATLESPVYGVRVVGCDPPTPDQIAAALPPRPPPPAVPAAPVVNTPAATPNGDLGAAPPSQDLASPPGDQ